MVYSQEMIVDDVLYALLAFSVNSIANVTLTSLRHVLPEVKHSCPAWLSLLHPHSLLDTKGAIAVLGGGDSTKVQSIDLSHWKHICSEFYDIFGTTGTPPDRAIKHKIDLLPNYVPLAKR